MPNDAKHHALLPNREWNQKQRQRYTSCPLTKKVSEELFITKPHREVGLWAVRVKLVNSLRNVKIVNPSCLKGTSGISFPKQKQKKTALEQSGRLRIWRCDCALCVIGNEFPCRQPHSHYATLLRGPSTLLQG